MQVYDKESVFSREKKVLTTFSLQLKLSIDILYLTMYDILLRYFKTNYLMENNPNSMLLLFKACNDL